MNLSLRIRLIGAFLVVIVTAGAITTVVGVHMVTRTIDDLGLNEARHDLSAARAIYQSELNSVLDSVRHTARRFFVRDALAGVGNIDSAAAELSRVRQREGLDILTVTDSRGTVFVRTRNPSVKGDTQAADVLIQKAMAGRTAVAATQIVPREELLNEGQDLADRARTVFVPTPMAKPTAKKEETSGMLLKAAAVVVNERGDVLGTVYGGKLINGSFGLVDNIKGTLYRFEQYRGSDVGSATIFQGDLRISTNVLDAKGQRAVGTRISGEVHDRVFGQEKPWIERAFVVNDWYITAYAPIRDISGQIVGVLYVGVLERKFVDMKRNALLVFLSISLGATALSVGICCLLSGGLARPVHALVDATRRLAAGDLKQRVGPDKSTREIGELGSAFNQMAHALEERDQRLRLQAQEQILRSEKLAMIGRLAAGVAHEINNPLGSILLFSHLLLRKVPSAGTERQNLERIAREADRCRNIVQGLLDFARQREPKAESLNINEVVLKPIALLENQAIFHNITVLKQLRPDLPPVLADGSQLQQVFVNMLANAAEAMDGEGTLTVDTRLAPSGDRVEVRFTDTGCGIPAENMARVFEPFFTTKDVGGGTGLGLSISYGIVQRHGGTITVQSRVGEGSTFVVSLLTAEAAAKMQAIGEAG